MRKLFVFIFSVLVFSSSAQSPFQNLSLNDALTKAKTESKFILLQFEAADCVQCNDVANKGFDNKELSARMEQSFVCFKVDANNSERSRIGASYNLSAQKSFGTLFLDANGTLLHSFMRTTTRSQEYLAQIETALTKAGEVLNIAELEREHKNGNRGFGFLEILLQKRKAVHMPTDALLDEYIDVLPADSLVSVRTVAFIMQMAPLLNTKADKVVRSNASVMNKAWYSLSLPLRAGINNSIVYKSMEKAIREKDERYATETSRFAQRVNEPNHDAATKAFDMNMLRYYDGVKDTTNYFRKSIAYYERYFLSVSPDSIKRTDSMNMRRMLQTAKKDTVRDGNRMRIAAQVTYAPIVQRFSSELNNGAYNFYLRTDNPYLLSIATEWSKRAAEFYESPEVLDTYAKLLYKQNRKSEAIEEITKAIALQKKRGFPTKLYEAALEKMTRNEKFGD
ncbi:DUF255 domain-containing protein [Flavisolibacter ginsenosidimutans]|uniref:DUF255 domain-containing protein n=1 Tax=Flavisolibacter ginsenosidimutans TaxID=661481 RepID=A0A5B8UMH1_9BACT|nr:DUF255 domain-containing protein [Flavisolibacter ginsenosidimutans]QEC57768.1 DUF255 domain-containing protein [Flavisolibacter ginsenosidimutans]